MLPNLHENHLKAILVCKFFLSHTESDMLKAIETPLGNSNFSREEWNAIRWLAYDRNVVIKRADERSCVVIWDRNHYVKEAGMQLKNHNIYKSLKFKDKILIELVEKSNQFSKSLKAGGIISEEEPQDFTYKYQKASSRGKMYFLSKIHRMLFDVSGKSLISNCGTPTENALEFLNHYFKRVMQKVYQRCMGFS